MIYIYTHGYPMGRKCTLEKRLSTQASNMGGSKPLMSKPTLARLMPQYMQCSSTDARLPPSVIPGKCWRKASRYKHTLCSAQLKTKPPSCDSPSCQDSMSQASSLVRISVRVTLYLSPVGSDWSGGWAFQCITGRKHLSVYYRKKAQGTQLQVGDASRWFRVRLPGRAAGW